MQHIIETKLNTGQPQSPIYRVLNLERDFPLDHARILATRECMKTKYGCGREVEHGNMRDDGMPNWEAYDLKRGLHPSTASTERVSQGGDETSAKVSGKAKRRAKIVEDEDAGPEWLGLYGGIDEIACCALDQEVHGLYCPCPPTAHGLPTATACPWPPMPAH